MYATPTAFTSAMRLFAIITMAACNCLCRRWGVGSGSGAVFPGQPVQQLRVLCRSHPQSQHQRCGHSLQLPCPLVIVCAGGGVLVVGQEQDSLGSQFSSSESYVGHIHGLNLWNYSLSSDEIQRLAASCGHLGNVVAWPDLLGAINGHVRLLNTSFCAGKSRI